MAKSSIHIKGVKPNSEIHNKRLKEYNYVRKDLTPLNESWESESISDARKRINRTYREVTGKKIQKNAVTLKEGVVNLNPYNTMEDLQALKEKLYEKFKIKTIQIHIHRDEGHAKSKTWNQNLHAHMVFDWTNEEGKTLKLNMYDMVEIQDIVAETLRMKRGQKSDVKHLNAVAYKVQQAEKELEELQKKADNKENLINILNSDVQKGKASLQWYKEENEKMAAKNAKLKQEAEELKKTIEKLKQEEGNKSEIVGELLILREEVENKRKEKQALEDEKNKVQEEIDEKKANLDYLAGEGEVDDIAERAAEIWEKNPVYSTDLTPDELITDIYKKVLKVLGQKGYNLRR